MDKYWSKDFYNPNAIYEEGLEVKKEVDEYRTKIAKMLSATKEGIIFTSGGTEANTWAIRGVKNNHLAIDAESHPSVFEAAEGLNISTWQAGKPMPIQKDTTLVSAVVVDNKAGRRVREERKKRNANFPLLHIDASQTAGYFNVGLEALACDLLTIDSAKLYGPKGIGILAIRRGVKLNLPPQGTPAVPLISGFTKALEIAVQNRESEHKRLNSLSAEFVEAIRKFLPQVSVTKSVPNIINVSVPGILPELLVLALDRAGVLVSAGPACSSNKPEPPDTPVRFSFGRFTTSSEVRRAIEIFCSVASSMVK